MEYPSDRIKSKGRREEHAFSPALLPLGTSENEDTWTSSFAEQDSVPSPSDGALRPCFSSAREGLTRGSPSSPAQAAAACTPPSPRFTLRDRPFSSESSSGEQHRSEHRPGEKCVAPSPPLRVAFNLPSSEALDEHAGRRTFSQKNVVRTLTIHEAGSSSSSAVDSPGGLGAASFPTGGGPSNHLRRSRRRHASSDSSSSSLGRTDRGGSSDAQGSDASYAIPPRRRNSWRRAGGSGVPQAAPRTKPLAGGFWRHVGSVVGRRAKAVERCRLRRRAQDADWVASPTVFGRKTKLSDSDDEKAENSVSESGPGLRSPPAFAMAVEARSRKEPRTIKRDSRPARRRFSQDPDVEEFVTEEHGQPRGARSMCQASMPCLEDLHWEISQWYRSTDFYAEMTALEPTTLDLLHEHKHPVTGRLRVGGLSVLLCLLLYSSLFQSAMSTVPLDCLLHGNFAYAACAFLWTAISVFPLLVTDIALGQACQGSVLRLFDALSPRLRGVAVCTAIYSCFQTLQWCMVCGANLLVLFDGLVGIPGWIPSAEAKEACPRFSSDPIKCKGTAGCSFSESYGCRATTIASIWAAWRRWCVTRTVLDCPVWPSLCAVGFLVLFGYIATKGPALIAVSSCSFSSVLTVLLPIIIIIGKMTVAEGDTAGYWQTNDITFDNLISTSLIFYIPGDGFISTLTSYADLDQPVLFAAAVLFLGKWVNVLLTLEAVHVATVTCLAQFGVVRPSAEALTKFLSEPFFLPFFKNALALVGSVNIILGTTHPFCRIMSVVFFVCICAAFCQAVGVSFLVPWSVCCDASCFLRRQEPNRSIRRLLPFRESDAVVQGTRQTSRELGHGQLYHKERSQLVTSEAQPRGGRASADEETAAVREAVQSGVHQGVQLNHVLSEPSENRRTQARLLPLLSRFRLGQWWSCKRALEEPPASTATLRFRRGEESKGCTRSDGACGPDNLVLPPWLLFILLHIPIVVVGICIAAPAYAVKQWPGTMFKSANRQFANVILFVGSSAQNIYISWVFGVREQVRRAGYARVIGLWLIGVALPVVCGLFHCLRGRLSCLLVFAWATEATVAMLIAISHFGKLYRKPVLVLSARDDSLSLGRSWVPRRSVVGQPANCIRRLDTADPGTRFMEYASSVFTEYYTCDSTKGRHTEGSFNVNRLPSKACVTDVRENPGNEARGRQRRHGLRGLQKLRSFFCQERSCGLQNGCGVPAPRQSNFSRLEEYCQAVKDDLYWAFLGNVEMMRVNLNVALTGKGAEPLPQIWGFLLKFVCTPILSNATAASICDAAFYFVSDLRAGLLWSGPCIAVWTVVLSGLACSFAGLFFPDLFESMLPRRRLSFLPLWLPLSRTSKVMALFLETLPLRKLRVKQTADARYSRFACRGAGVADDSPEEQSPRNF